MTRFANEKLVWEGEDPSEDDIFFTPLESPIKVHSSGSGSVVSSNQTHLMYNGTKHVAIVEQLTTHIELWNSLQASTLEQSKSKQPSKCDKIIKTNDRKPQPKCSRFAYN
jgi:hypothetical protein